MSAPAIDDARPNSAATPGSVEAPLVLDTAAETPKTLGFRDQFAFWANLGVSLIGFSGAAAFLAPEGYPQLSLIAATVAITVGTVVGTAMVAVSGLPGAATGAPAMALLRGLFGTKLSYLPTAMNIIQCVGWGVFELTVIAMGSETLVKHFADDAGPHWIYIVAAGALTTLMTIRPLGMLRILRRYVTVAVGVAMLYFSVQLVRAGVPDLNDGSWSGFLPVVDASVALAVSWVPLASDYTRHSRGAKQAFWGTLGGYTTTGVWCSLLGILALAQTPENGDIFQTLLGISAGWVFFAVLVVREVDQSFANVYSTAMSLQNLVPRVDRRVISLAVGALVTGLATQVDDFSKYESFLYLIGSVFVPLLGVTAVDWFLGRGRASWNLRQDAPARWAMLLPWILGFAVYQLINPGTIGWWADFWTKAQDALHVHPQSWTSATLFSFAASALGTLALVRIDRARTAPAG
ncbi:purine-cytosine permease family protein [Yinghuangia seranimata]|uniref:purine-cytosine permease family protein n=1 Tax=Yinghuangia seranimata TaxID=408067 RepID=UPI00248B2D89|nr:cytosine permease [Yinghuangia seranimata]MDI2131889.1 cytosine permease [Yinghuangia seranimata]